MKRTTTRIVLGLLLLLAAAFLFHREAREEKPVRPPKPPDVVDPPPPEPEPVAAAVPKPTPPPPPPPRPKSPTRKPVDPFEPAHDRGELGILRGRVRMRGKPPVRAALQMQGDCVTLHQGVVLNDDLVVDPKGGVRWAFVYVKVGTKTFTPPPKGPELLDQKGCVFAPHVLGVRVGQPLVIKNNDPVMHTVHAATLSNMEFSVSVVPGAETTQRLRKREVMLRVGCDLHPWESAWIGVMDHPHFAVTGEEGAYAIPNLPAGRYIVEVWHEKFASVSKEVDLGRSDDYPLDFLLDARKE